MSRKVARLKRATRTRARIKESALETGLVRLTLNRTPRHVYAQLLAPEGGKVLAQASSLELRSEKLGPGKLEVAKKVGTLIAERANKAGVTKVACDRSGFKYHGRIAALVDAARENGLQV